MNHLPQCALGSQGLTTSVEGLSCLGMSDFAGGTIYGETDETESIATIHHHYSVNRVDPAVPIVETIGAMSRLVEAGRVSYLSVSETTGINPS